MRARVYPPKSQFTPENVQGWIGKLGPLQDIRELTPNDEGLMFELELTFQNGSVSVE